MSLATFHTGNKLGYTIRHSIETCILHGRLDQRYGRPKVLLHAFGQNYIKCNIVNEARSKSQNKQIPHFPRAINSSHHAAQILMPETALQQLTMVSEPLKCQRLKIATMIIEVIEDPVKQCVHWFSLCSITSIHSKQSYDS